MHRLHFGSACCGYLVLLLIASAGIGAEEEKVLFADDFASFDSGWGVQDDIMRVADHAMRLSLPPGKGRIALYQPLGFDRIDARVKVSLLDGEASQAAGGITFWATDYANCYVASLDVEGKLVLSSYRSGNRLLILPAKVRSSVHAGRGQSNDLRVVTSGSMLTIYVNGDRAVTLRGYPPAGHAMVGVYGEAMGVAQTWALSDLNVRRGPEPASPQPADDAILYRDDFQSLDPAWGEPESECAKAEGGKLILVPRTGRSYTQLYRGCYFGSCDYSVKVSTPDAGDDAVAGLAFWGRDTENCYYLMIDRKGMAYLGQRSEGKPQGKIRTKLSAIRQDIGQTNELLVVMRGSRAIAIVNGQNIGTVKLESKPIANSLIGVCGESGEKTPYHWEFSDLTVRKP